MPTNIVMARTAMATSVAAAFFDSGGRNAGTPFDTASTPVIAVQPFADAVSTRKTDSVACSETGSDAVTAWTEPVSTRHAPTPISASALAMKKYVGTAK